MGWPGRDRGGGGRADRPTHAHAPTTPPSPAAAMLPAQGGVAANAWGKTRPKIKPTSRRTGARTILSRARNPHAHAWRRR
eukprot:8908778-Lingulodinium_polyedra.AAC.1